MKRVYPETNWPDSWKQSYCFDLEEVYDEVSDPGYAYAYATRKNQTLRLLTESLAPGARILDVAGAQGNFSLTLAEMGYKVTWNDLREDLIEYVRSKHEFGEIDFVPGNVFEIGSITPFDAVLITEIIEHVAHPDEFLVEMAKLVIPGGYIVMTTPNGEYFRNSLPKFSDCPDPSKYEEMQFKPDSNGHIFLLHQEEIGTLAERAGLEIEEMTLFTNPLTNGHLKLNSLLNILPSSIVRLIENLTQRLPLPISKKVLIGHGVRLRKPMT